MPSNVDFEERHVQTAASNNNQKSEFTCQDMRRSGIHGGVLSRTVLHIYFAQDQRVATIRGSNRKIACEESTGLTTLTPHRIRAFPFQKESSLPISTVHGTTVCSDERRPALRSGVSSRMDCNGAGVHIVSLMTDVRFDDMSFHRVCMRTCGFEEILIVANLLLSTRSK